jgi:hypothetical protein
MGPAGGRRGGGRRAAAEVGLEGGGPDMAGGILRVRGAPSARQARDERWSYHHHAASTGAAVLRRRLSVRHLPPPAVDRAPCSVADCNQLTVSIYGTEQRCRHDHRAVCQSRTNANARARIGLSSFAYTCMNVALQRVCEKQRLCQLGKWHGGHADAANRAWVRKQSAIMPCHRPDGALPWAVLWPGPSCTDVAWHTGGSERRGLRQHGQWGGAQLNQ